MSKNKNRNRQQGAQPNRKIDSAVLVAIIGLISTIIVALIAFPPIVTWWNNKLNSTPTPIAFITETPTPFVSETLTFTSDVTLTQQPTETITFTPFELPTFSSTENPQKMIANMTASASEGKAPFTVNFNAKSSYVDVEGDQDLFCTFENVCNYTWSVRLGGSNVYGPTLDASSFSYTFDKKGEYTIVVEVCRGKTKDVCNYAIAVFTAK